jgi:hypothetical protein
MAIRPAAHDAGARAATARSGALEGTNPLGLPPRFELVVTLHLLSDMPGKVASTKTFACEAALAPEGPFSERRVNYCEDQVGSERRGHVVDFYLPPHQAVHYDAFAAQVFERTERGIVEHRMSVVRRCSAWTRPCLSSDRRRTGAR